MIEDTCIDCLKKLAQYNKIHSYNSMYKRINTIITFRAFISYTGKYKDQKAFTSAKRKLCSGCPSKLRGALGPLSVSIGPVTLQAPIFSL